MDHELPPTIIDKTLSPALVNILGIVLMPILGVLAVIPYWLIWREMALSALDVEFIVIAIIPSIFIHEGLHWVGYRLGGAAWRDVKFGFQIKGLMPYAHCRVPLTAAGYRLGVALPALVLGAMPTIIGTATGSSTLTAYGAMMIIAAVGDLIVLAMLLPIPGNARVQDHPSRPGFQVLPG
ncbi:MAG: DUF3267 domain-containing protein [Anaerolineae bacterium]|nr:DUF3267 domain-containing protein [Anaerolineae bacterium]